MATIPAIAVLVAYYGALAIVTTYALHRLYLTGLSRRHEVVPSASELTDWPKLCVQLPLFNEPSVAERLIEATSRLEYPGELAIQVLDDSTDATPRIVASVIERARGRGVVIEHIRRSSRDGYKAGALAFGMARSDAELFAIFDADFVPPPETLLRMVPSFSDTRVGMVQARWTHLNRDHGALTRAQALFLDAHFAIESAGRFASGRFFNFNGTAGIWRRRAVEEAGGWSAATVTEDLDLSYRAQMAGWQFVFLPDVEIPAELPPTMGAFHEQQFRWAKGSIQTARRRLIPILRSRLATGVKLEAFFHLTGNSAYLVTLLLALTIVPAMEVRRAFHWSSISIIDALFFGISTASVTWFYIEGQRRIGRGRPPWRDLAAVMPIGIGLSARNSVAVIEGIMRRGGEFRRTPKHGSSRLVIEPVGGIPLAESLLALYFAAAVVAALIEAHFTSLPFLGLFLAGYAYVAVRRWAERRPVAHAPVTAHCASTLQRPHTTVIIPALDEETAVGHVLRSIPSDSVDEVIVVDNGSRDRTAIVAAENGARVVFQPERGYGAACLAGLAALDPATRLIVFLDADYSDYPDDLPLLLRPIVDGNADCVIGSRTRVRSARRALTIQQRFGNWLATALIVLIWRRRFTDLGPFRAIRRESLDALGMTDRNFGWNVEMQIKALEKKLRIVEVPVRYRNRIGHSKISGTIAGTLLAGMKILYTIGRYACA